MGFLKDLREAKKLTSEIQAIAPGLAGSGGIPGGGGGGGSTVIEGGNFVTNVTVQSDGGISKIAGPTGTGVKRVGGDALGQKILSSLQRIEDGANLGYLMVRTGGG